MVVVGELSGEHESRERLAVGETPNLAARALQLATENSNQFTRCTATNSLLFVDVPPGLRKTAAQEVSFLGNALH